MALSGRKTRAVFDRHNIVSESDLTDAADKLQVTAITNAGAVAENHRYGRAEMSAVELLGENF